MKSQHGLIVCAIISGFAGLLTLIGYFIHTPLLAYIRGILLEGAVALSGIAVIVGVIHYASMHLHRLKTEASARAYSLIAILGLLGGATVMLVPLQAGETTQPAVLWLMNSILFPTESALLALLAVVLLSAVVKLLFRRRDVSAYVFCVTVLIVMVGSLVIVQDVSPVGRDVLVWLRSVPGVAGGRGILLGISLGVVATAVRILLGFEHPYDG